MEASLRWKTCNIGGTEEIYGTLEEAKKAMENEGYVDLGLQADTAITGDDGWDICSTIYYYAHEDDLPRDWQRIDEISMATLIRIIYGDGYEPCIVPCL